MILKCILLVLLQMAAAILTGGIFAPVAKLHLGGEKKTYSLLFSWVSGQMILWALFFVCAVPIILRGQRFETVQKLFSIGAIGLMGAGALISGITFFLGRKKKAGETNAAQPDPESGIEKNIEEKFKINSSNSIKISWIVFALLYLLQMILICILVYVDGDDAFYVATAADTASHFSMYLTDPYTGTYVGLSSRHCLAPFPLWLSLLSRFSDLRVVVIAHIVMPIYLISLAYGIFALIAAGLFRGEEKKWRGLFLVAMELLLIFGDTSSMTMENFLMVRSRQGKAALAGLVIPFLFFLFLKLFQRLEEEKKHAFLAVAAFIPLLWCVNMAACLCSSLGALLCCVLTGLVGIAGAICYKKFWILFPLAVSCLPSLACAVLYLKL